MSDSILESTKKLLGIEIEDNDFDFEITMYINATFSTLEQLGIGPSPQFMIEDDVATWAEFIEERKNLGSVRAYMGMAVKLIFDPPTSSFGLAALKEQLEKAEWRMQTTAELVTLPPPIVVEVPGW